MKFYTKSVKVFILTLKDQEGSTIAVKLFDAEKNGNTYTAQWPVDENYIPFDSTQGFEGWTPFINGCEYGKKENNNFCMPTYASEPPANVYHYDADDPDVVTLTGDLVLFPYITSGYWITFSTNIKANNLLMYGDENADKTSATYYSPYFFCRGTHIKNSDLPTPTRTGYTFAGWYTDKSTLQTPFTNDTTGVTISENTTIYAKWDGKTVDYSVVYMFEKYNDAGTESERYC